MTDKILSVRVPDDLHAALIARAATATLKTGKRVTVSDLIRTHIRDMLDPINLV